MTTLKDALNELDKHGPSYNKSWVQFVMDYFIPIREHSTSHSISLGEMYRYRYRPEDFLASLNKDISIAWIMLLINQIPGRAYFNNLSSILIPDTDYLYQLKEKFDTFQMLEANIEEVSISD